MTRSGLSRLWGRRLDYFVNGGGLLLRGHVEEAVVHFYSRGAASAAVYFEDRYGIFPIGYVEALPPVATGRVGKAWVVRGRPAVMQVRGLDEVRKLRAGVEAQQPASYLFPLDTRAGSANEGKRRECCVRASLIVVGD